VPVIGQLLPATLAADGAIIPGGYNMLVTMHATVMVFFVIMPLLIGTFGNYLIPLQIGAGDMAFPLLNEISYWLYFLSGIFLLAAFFVPGGAPGTGWTAYAPLSAVGAYNGTQMGQSLWGVAIFVNGLSSIAGATNYITTVVNMRFVKPLDAAVVRELARTHELLVTVEEHQVMGGAGSAVCELLADGETKVLLLGLPDRFIDHGDPGRLLASVGLDAEGIQKSITAVIGD
jgi:hypothetical protein